MDITWANISKQTGKIELCVYHFWFIINEIYSLIGLLLVAKDRFLISDFHND